MKSFTHLILLTVLIVVIAMAQTKETYACQAFLANPNKPQLLAYINQTGIENSAGECALGALSEYNQSGLLEKYNISVNLTLLNQEFLSGNPLLPPPNLTVAEEAIAANYTTINTTLTGLVCIKFTPKSDKASSNSQRVHIHKCNHGWEKNSEIELNLTASNTTIMISNEAFNISNATSQATTITEMAGYDNFGSDPAIVNLPLGNWAGYVSVSDFSNPQNAVSQIAGSWIVQPALGSPNQRASAQWIGIGGFNANSGKETGVIQIGTASCDNYATTGCNSQLGPSYGAWFECHDCGVWANLPLLLHITPGDRIAANITLSGYFWHADIKDLNTSQARDIIYPATLLGTATVQNNSAEWIDERPSYLFGAGFVNFTNFVSTNYISANATINSTTGAISSFDSYNLSLYNPTGIPNDTAISTNFTGSAFTIHNFRTGIGISYSHMYNLTINQGESYSIASLTPDVATGIAGGTGPYRFQWLVNYSKGAVPVNPRFANADNCGIPSGVGNTPICSVQTNTSTRPGNYTYELEATNDDVSNEIIYSNLVTVDVTALKVNSVSIAITNTQQVSTPSPFQQMLDINSSAYSSFINSNWDNVEFSTGPNATGTILQSWVESGASDSATNTIVWVKLPYSIPAYGSATVYMNFMLSTNVMSSSGPTGEAPQLSPTYGQYDNGGQVFNYYDNFTSSLSGWTTNNVSSMSASDGLHLVFKENGYFVGPSEGVGTAFDADVTNDILGEMNIGYININQPTTWLNNRTAAWASAIVREACGGTYPEQVDSTSEANYCGLVSGRIVYGAEFLTGIFTVNPFSSSSSFQFLDYSVGTSTQPITVDAPNYPARVGFAQMRNGNETDPLDVQWARVRAGPPNGIMPSFVVDPPGVDSAISVAVSTTTTSTTVSSTVTTIVPVNGTTSTSSTSSSTTTM